MQLKNRISFDLDEHALIARWLADGQTIVAVPTAGHPVMREPDGKLRELPAHGLGNGFLAIHPVENGFVTGGADGNLRIYDSPTADPRIVSLGRAWLDRGVWNAPGTLLAVGVGKILMVLNPAGEVVWKSALHKSTICDIAWNPSKSDELAVACDGGAYLWRIGDHECFARFDWGGASLIILWSPDARWVVTGNQTSSVHLYDIAKDFPLHIQGYDTKVKALAFSSNAKNLATGGGGTITVWRCTGKTGPENTTPRMLDGHDDVCTALAYRNGHDFLASGGADGRILVFQPEVGTRPVAATLMESAVVSVAWHPSRPELLATCASGQVVGFEVL